MQDTIKKTAVILSRYSYARHDQNKMNNETMLSKENKRAAELIAQVQTQI